MEQAYAAPGTEGYAEAAPVADQQYTDGELLQLHLYNPSSCFDLLRQIIYPISTAELRKYAMDFMTRCYYLQYYQ